MKLVTNKKKKVVTVRMSETQLRDVYAVIGNFLEFRAVHELKSLAGFSTEDNNMVLRFIVDDQLEESSVKQTHIYRRA